MLTHLHRSIDYPIRKGLTYDELWDGPDRGLIWCWEGGRQIRDKEPELTARASEGEVMMLAWKRGTEIKGKTPTRNWIAGTLQYLATWQGLRGENLDLRLNEDVDIVCTKTGKRYRFRSRRDVQTG